MTNPILTFIRGDTEQIRVIFDAKVDTTDKLLTMTIREAFSEKILYQDSIPANGELIFQITHEQSKQFKVGIHKFDIELASKNKSYVKTLVIGMCNVIADVTY